MEMSGFYILEMCLVNNHTWPVWPQGGAIELLLSHNNNCKPTEAEDDS